MNGWFAMYRSMFEHPIFEGNMERVGVWAWMLATAAWKDTRQDANGKTVVVKRGQLLTSYRQMSKATGVGVQALRTLIARLQAERAINTETNTGRLLITICKYEQYQHSEGQGNTGSNTRATQDQHTKEQGNKDITLEANASKGAVAPVEVGVLSKAVWDAGKPFLASRGVKNPGAMIGKWLSEHGPLQLLAALEAAQKAGTQDPIPYITEALKGKANGKKSDGAATARAKRIGERYAAQAARGVDRWPS